MLKEKLEEDEDSKHQLEKQVQDLQQKVYTWYWLYLI
jgi:hypothetical protein